MDDSTINSVLQLILVRSEPLPLPSRWEFLRRESTVRRLTCDPVDLRNALQTRCNREMLLKMGVFVRSGIDDVALCPPLDKPQAPFAASFREEVESPHELLTSDGILPVSQEPAVFGAMNDFRTKSAAMKFKKRVVVAFNLTDLAVLRSLGFAATTATGLASMKGRELRLLFGRPKVGGTDVAKSRTATRADISRHGARIVLADWDISSLSRKQTDEGAKICSQMAKAESSLGFDTSRLSTWKPTTRELSEFSDAAEFEDQNALRQLFRESLDESVRPASTCIKVPTKKLTLLDAYRELSKELLRSERIRGNERTLASKLLHYSELWEKEIVEPLLKEARDQSQPIRRAILSQIAEITGRGLAASQLVKEAKWKIRGGRRTERPDSSNMNELIQLAQQLLASHKELSG
ncbi:MAG: hypothetical protein ACI92S_003425 [Planctomycetaceae bacterium]|jgi:hypothetical protein